MKVITLNSVHYDEIVQLWKRSGLSIKEKGRDSRESILKQMGNDPESFIGVMENDRLVGIAIATSDGRKGWINRLAVDPAYRRRGVATMLIDQSIKKLNKEGINIYAALIEDWNNASMQLFKKNNFVEHREIVYFTKRESEEV